MIQAFQWLSRIAVPSFIVFILGYGFYKKVPVYEAFVDGAREGLTTAIRILPYLAAMLIAIGVFRASGAMELLTYVLSPVTSRLGVPPEILPLALMRPMSGSASIGILAELLQIHGPDTFTGRAASTMMGSTETTFYTASIYLGSVGHKDTRYILAAGLLADFIGFTASIVICAMVFGR
ncbi:MAG: spore maturation protein [Caldicoprobacterales bacterium]|jgi:spore maturation protein B|nr:spore maturation protein [Clostridiales bacterium]